MQKGETNNSSLFLDNIRQQVPDGQVLKARRLHRHSVSLTKL
jgi:hypothetical protein